jgi:hypothetical protein
VSCELKRIEQLQFRLNKYFKLTKMMKCLSAPILLFVSINICTINICTVEAQELPTKNETPVTPPKDLKLEGLMTASIYYKPSLRNQNFKCETTDKKNILDPNGKVIIEVCSSIYKSCLMEGSCTIELEDKKTISLNYFHIVDGVRRFKVDTKLTCPYGFGSRSICLDPFYSIAADITKLPLGSVIYIPEVVGTHLPNGDKHSGYFIVRDIGEAIVGENRFDFFTGSLSYKTLKNPFLKIGLDKSIKQVSYYTVQGETAQEFLKLRKFPRIP